jgi:hypothetical protein
MENKLCFSFKDFFVTILKTKENIKKVISNVGNEKAIPLINIMLFSLVD